MKVPAALPLSRRLRALVVVSGAYYLNGTVMLFDFNPPLQLGHGLLLGVLLLQFVLALVLVMRRLPRRGLLLFGSSAMTLTVLLLWTGHHITSQPGWSGMLHWP